MSTKTQTTNPNDVIARQDSIQVWSLPYLYVIVIGVGFLFTFFDINDINVSFLQTCTQIVPHCLAGLPPGATSLPSGSVLASAKLGLPVLWNLIGWVIGVIILCPLADRFGRRDLLLVTLVITGLGSLFTAFANDYTTFILARMLTGIGVGADVAIVNTYISEVAPRQSRAKFISLIFIMSGLGAVVSLWLGVALTTPPALFPLGLPFAQAHVLHGVFLGNGWRILYLVGAVLALIGIVLRIQLPESPRWLVSRGRVSEADEVVQRMEALASSKSAPATHELVSDAPLPVQSGTTSNGLWATFASTQYLGRVALLFLIWFFAFVTLYSIAAGLTTVLAALRYAPPEAGIISAFGSFGFVACGIFAYVFAERLERKYWLPIGAVLTPLGGVLIAIAGRPTAPTLNGTVILAFIGSMILYFGINIWVPMAYAWSAENFPTRARTTGFGIVNGIGHLGGGIGLLVIAQSVLPALRDQPNGPLYVLLVISAGLIVAAVLAQFGIATRGLRLDEVSP
jgi:MFS family permease